MFNSNDPARPPTRSGMNKDTPRATSPAPQSPGGYRTAQQAAPPSPSTYRPAQRQSQPSPAPATNYNRTASPAPTTNYNRAASPNPYAASTAGGRPRANTTTATAQAYGTPIGRNSYSSASPAPRGASPQPPFANSMPRGASPQPPFANSRPASRAGPSSRAVSPQPQFARPSYERPSSSRSDMAGSIRGAGSERGEGSVFGGSTRGRPQSSYYGGGGGGGGGGSGSSVRAESRVRSKSLAEPKNYNKDGRIILNYCKFSDDVVFARY